MTPLFSPHLRRVAVVVVSLIVAGVPCVAHADDGTAVDRARVHYDRGLELFNAGEHQLALIELQRAYDIAPTYRLLYFIGQAQIRVGALAGALPTLEQYLAEGGAEIPSVRRDEVARDIAGLRARTARLTVTCNVDGATITVNGKEVGTTPLAPQMLVAAGDTRVSASKAGYVTATRERALAGADDETITLDLVPLIATPPPLQAASIAPQPSTRTTPASTEAASTSSSTTPIIVGWSVTAAAVVGAVISGAFAVSAVDRVDELRSSPISGTPGQAQSDIAQERSVARTWMLVTDIFAASALVAGGISLYLTLRSPPREVTSTPSTPRRTTTTLTIAPRPMGADLRVVF